MLILDAPEEDTHLALVDVTASDATGAIKAAWAMYRPGESHALKLISPEAARNGWDERKTVSYETSAAERAVLSAIAMARGGSWSVLILDGSEQTFAKRSAAIKLVATSIRPRGYVGESFAGRKAAPLDAGRIELMRSFVVDAMKELGIPGASFALLDNGKVVYEGGVGLREIDKTAPVDANTLFMAASNTKGMSTLLLATLADQGKLRWEQPVTELYPSFKLGSDAATKKIQVKHLVCACTGLPRTDLEWIFEYRNAGPETSFKMLATHSPNSGIGEVFQYNNLMAAAAGYIGGHLAYPALSLGDAYDKAMQVSIFDPLGMKDTTFNMKRALKSNHASGHSADLNNRVRVDAMTLNYSVVPHRPTGGVWTSAHDLIRYVQLEADKGMLPDGTRLVSAENLLMRRTPQIAAGENVSYGMGLFAETAWGVPVVYHGGGLFGYKSNIYLLPEAGVGAVLLTNSDSGQSLLRPFLRRLMELVYDGKAEAVEDVKIAAKRNAADLANELKRLTLPADSAAAAQLAKRYVSLELGELQVQRKGKDLVFDFGEWSSVMASRKSDDGSMSFVTALPEFEGFPFVVGNRDGKRVLIALDGQHEYVFNEHGDGNR
ncbi:beta-lactamase [Janthinobacterium lividum]|nr:beta-lactamase [Janthinobacterium lividum]